MAHRAVTYCLLGDVAKGKELVRQTLEIKPDFNGIFWKEMNFFNPHPDSRSGLIFSRRCRKMRLGPTPTG